MIDRRRFTALVDARRRNERWPLTGGLSETAYIQVVFFRLIMTNKKTHFR